MSDPSADSPILRRWAVPPTVRDVGRADWSQRRLRGSLVLLPTILLCLAWGAWRHDPEGGVMAAGGAVSVGFGAFQNLGRRRALPMGAMLLAMATATFVGSVTHRYAWPADVAVTVLAGWLFGLITTLGQGAWWVGLQGVIGLLAFGAMPADVPEAGRHGAMVIAGGLVQLIAVHLYWTIAPPPGPPQPVLRRAWLYALVRNASPGTVGGRHALRVAVAVGGGAGLHHALQGAIGLTHGYWIPMTAAILLKPDWHETFARGLGRLGGTLVGAGLATLLAAFVRPGPLLLAAWLTIAIWACFALQKVNYALYAVCITTYVVFTLAAGGLPGPQTALARVEATLIGAAVAVAVHAVPLGKRR